MSQIGAVAPQALHDLGNIFIRNSDFDCRIIGISSAPLTAPGENYGSIMLAVELTLEDPKNSERKTVHAAVKMVPKNKLIQKIFLPEITFPKEIEVYRTIIPIFERFQNKHGIRKAANFVPKYYGSRYGLDPNKFDLNAVLMLENLKKNSFLNIDRTVGCDFDTAKLVLQELAKMHALGIAVKIQDREIFIDNILPHLKPLKSFYGFDLERTQNQLMKIVREDPECEKYLEKYQEAIGRSKYGTISAGECVAREPWATVAHCDFWISNVMVKFKGSKPIECKIFDFQCMSYDSPGRDLAVFLFTSVQNAVIQNQLNQLIEEYLNEFLAFLNALEVDVKVFTKDSLMVELEASIREKALLHSCFLLRLIFASNKNAKAVEDIDMEVFTKEEEVSQLYKEKLWLIVKEVGKRNWL